MEFGDVTVISGVVGRSYVGISWLCCVGKFKEGRGGKGSKNEERWERRGVERGSEREEGSISILARPFFFGMLWLMDSSGGFLRGWVGGWDGYILTTGKVNVGVGLS